MNFFNDKVNAFSFVFGLGLFIIYILMSMEGVPAGIVLIPACLFTAAPVARHLDRIEKNENSKN